MFSHTVQLLDVQNRKIIPFLDVNQALCAQTMNIFSTYLVFYPYLDYLCTMRVLIVNTSERTGGAALAANRLMEALNNNGVKAKMLVRDKETEALTVVGLNKGWLSHWHFLKERWAIFAGLHFNKKHLFEVDIANSGFDITGMREFREADIIHLSWINQGMLSLSDIKKILDSGKPVVWTMHDAWPATAICHYPHGCKAFTTTCRRCRLLPGHGGQNDLANRVWNRKKQILDRHHISFVACSRWLEQQAKQSALIAQHSITNIPNPIDIRVFRPMDKQGARQRLGLPEDKRLILFVSQRVTDERKGMSYLMDAMNLLIGEKPDVKDRTAVAILGGHAEDFEGKMPLPVYPLGYVSDEKKIVDVYNAVDVFVLPSLEDNLPNTIMEAMACGIPCVGFKTGGIPEEIDHKKNGSVAEYRHAEDLAHGIQWVLDEADYASLSAQAVKKVATHYSQNSVSLRYIEVYNQALAYKHYSL